MRHRYWIALALTLALVAALLSDLRGSSFDGPASEPLAPAGVTCFRGEGEPRYCRCLDRLDEARRVAGRPAAGMPPLDHPAVRYALRRPDLFPILTGDSPRCIRVPAAGDAA